LHLDPNFQPPKRRMGYAMSSENTAAYLSKFSFQ
jgi:hypothetical protein